MLPDRGMGPSTGTSHNILMSTLDHIQFSPTKRFYLWVGLALILTGDAHKPSLLFMRRRRALVLKRRDEDLSNGCDFPG